MATGNVSERVARRVVVTGGAGFIGPHVVEAFLARDYEVVVIDDLSTGSERNVPPAAELERVDIVEATAVARVFASFRPTVVCHLAAQASVTVSVHSPERDLQVNVSGTFNVLQEAQKGAAPVVFASTGGALYGDNAPIPSPGATWAEPLAPYGASKPGGAGSGGAPAWRPQRGAAPRQRLRPAPEPARRGRRRGDLQRPLAPGQGSARLRR